MTPEPDKIVGGKYRLERPLAKGGMGSVWVARHTELDSPVAVKFMAHELVGTPVAEARFKREAKAAAQLRSPHVVNIQDYGVEDGAPYMVMELLDGEDFGTELDRKRRVSVGRISTIVTQVAKALALAHAAGIVHRDIKPSNLFLARSGGDEIAKVLDFGVAKETMPTLVADKTTSGMLVGSPQYMSPEQARGESIDFASDLWSLGVVVFEALVGRPPFVSQHLGALLGMIHEARVEPPSSLAPHLPREIDTFIARAMARSPSARFPSAKAMAEDLAAIAFAVGDTAPQPPQEAAKPREAAPAKAAGRLESTLASTSAEPVSTTMAERASPAKQAEGGRKGALVLAVIAALVIALGAAAWLGLGGREEGSAVPAGAASMGTGSVPGKATAPAAIVSPAGVDPSSHGNAGAISANPTASQAAGTGPTSTSKTPGSVGPLRSATPSSKPLATSNPVPSLTIAPTVKVAPTYDPMFGLPSKTP